MNGRLSIFLVGLLFLGMAVAGSAAPDTQLPSPLQGGDLWQFSPGDCELSRFYEWQESGAPLPFENRAARVEELLQDQQFLEAFLWATAEKDRTEVVDPLVDHVLRQLAEPLDRWEARLKIEVPADKYYARADAIAQRLHIHFRHDRTAGELAAVRFSIDDQLRLTEILLVAAVDHIDETQAERILRFQFELDPNYERFCRWRAFAHHTRLNENLLAFERETSSTLPFAEVFEDLAIDKLRRHQEADAFQYLLALYNRFPERWRSHAAAIRTAYKARLARLSEQQRYDEAMRHLQLSEKFPFEVLDPDMATYAIFYKLLRDQEAHPSGGRQALIKFLLNHSVFTTASYVGEALVDTQQAAEVPQSYRAIMEAQLGNAGMTYRFLGAAVRAEPPSAAFFFALGLATERFKNLLNLAQRCYEQALQLNPQYEPALLALARHDVIRGDFQSALMRTDAVLERHPRNDLARYETARVHYVRGEYEQAEPIFEELADGQRARPDYYYFLAQIALKRNDPSRARLWLQRLLAQYRQDLRAYLLLADCARAEDNPELEQDALETLYQLSRPWRFERMEAARLFRLAADRLARLGAYHLCDPTFELSSVEREHTGPFIPFRKQAAEPWERPPRYESLRVEATAPPRWIMFEPEWDNIAPIVWRDLVGGVDIHQPCSNELVITNPTDHEMLGVRVFVDNREFAYIYRVLPESKVTINFRSTDFPSRLALIYTTDTGFEEAFLPSGTLTRRVDPAWRE